MMICKTPITVRYAETDQMGVVHHAVYPVWLEAARTDYIKQIGITYSQMEEMGILLPVFELQVKYRSPAKYEDELTVETVMQRITPARIVFTYRVYRNSEPDQTLVEGSSTHAWVDRTLRPMNMKKAFPELFAKISALGKQED